MVAGRLNKQIGGELGIAEKTVKVHRGRVMEKMEARSVAELVRDGGPRRSSAGLATLGAGTKVPFLARASARYAEAPVTPVKPLVAVVDDEEAVRRALERLLRSAGIETETFSTGGAMLEDLARRKPDCIVLDLHMPGMSGFEIQAALAERDLRIPVVVLTGHDTPEASERATASGAAAYLRKPVDGAVFLAAVAAAVENSAKNAPS